MRHTAMVLIVAAALAGCGSDEPQECSGDPGVACVFAGTGELRLGPDGLAPEETHLYWVADLEFAPDGTPYILDWNNHLVRRVVDGKVETVIGDFVGDGPPDMGDLMAPGAPGLTVNLNHPTDIQFDAQGRLVLCAWHNHKIRVWDPATGLVTVMAGRGGGFRGDDAPAGAMTLFNQPRAIAYAPDGSLLILDQRNFRIRSIGTDGVVHTIAGTGMAGFSGDDGPALMAQMKFEAGGNPEPSGGLTVDGDGTIYVADGLNHRIRRISTDGMITTIAGTGEAGFSGDDGPALMAQLSNPKDIELHDGSLYVADTDNNRIRAIDLETGVITTVAGNGEQGTGEEGQLAIETALHRPLGIAFDAAGALYVADTYNSRVLRVNLEQ